MSKELPKTISLSKKTQQEIMMRGVLDGLEEVATMMSYNPWPGDFEIIAVYPSEQENIPQREKVVITTKSKPTAGLNATVISFSERKKLPRIA